MAWNKIGNLAALSLVLFFAACGGDNSSDDTVSVDGTDNVREVASIEDLGLCASDRDGDTVYVTEKNVAYYCVDGSWVDINETDSQSSSSISAANIYSVLSSSSVPSVAEEKSSSSVSGSSEGIVTSSESIVVKINSSSKEAWVYLNPAISYGEMIDSRDGQVYKTVVIDNRTWMAQNLNYNYDKESVRSYCYNNSADSCAKYGRLYTWKAAVDACPEGWHLPNTGELQSLCGSLVCFDATELKTINGWNRDGYGNEGNGSDVIGFSALPAGIYDGYNGVFKSVGYSALFWSQVGGGETAVVMSDFVTATLSQRMACSVRCVQDYDEETMSSSSALPRSSSAARSSSSIAISSSNMSSSVALKISVTHGEMVDSRDGQIYKTVTIDNQTWMAQNLNYDYNKGTAKSFCYDNAPEMCDKYGRLYLWSAAVDSAAVFSSDGQGCGFGVVCFAGENANQPALVRGVCPEGWHLPNQSEWLNLAYLEYYKTNNTDTYDNMGTKLKSSCDWYVSAACASATGIVYCGNSGNGFDEYGFSALPTGYYDSFNNVFREIGYQTDFWSSVTVNADNGEFAYVFNMNSTANYASLDSKPFGSKAYAYSVRCLKDTN